MKKIFTIIYLCFVCIIGYSQNCPSYVSSSRSTMHTCNELGSISIDLGHFSQSGSVQIDFTRQSPYHVTWGTDYPSSESGTFNFHGGGTIDIYNLIAGYYELTINFPENPECGQIRHEIDVPYYKSYDYQNIFNSGTGHNYKYYSKSGIFYSHIPYPCIDNTLAQDTSIYTYGYQNYGGNYYFKWYKSSNHPYDYSEFGNTDELPEYGSYYCEAIDSHGCILETSPVYNIYNVPVSPPTAQEEQHFCGLNNPKISDIKYSVLPNNGNMYNYYGIVYDSPEINSTNYHGFNPELIDGKTYYILTIVDIDDSVTTNKSFDSVEFTPVTVHLYNHFDDAPPAPFEIVVSNSTISVVNPPQEIVYATESPYEPTYRYEYSLNNGDYVFESEFLNVPEGNHIIKIRKNKSNCEITEQPVIVGALKNLEFLSSNHIKIFPNPATTEIEIVNNLNDSIDSFHLYDLSGREILSLNSTEVTSKINISNLTKGTYLIKINTNSGILTSKMVKE